MMGNGKENTNSHISIILLLRLASVFLLSHSNNYDGRSAEGHLPTSVDVFEIKFIKRANRRNVRTQRLNKC